jgi:hypothetical protein
MKTNLIAAVVLGLATSGVVLAQELVSTAAAPATQPASTLVDLKFVELPSTNQGGVMYCGYGLDKNGQASWPFANQAGKMTVQFRDDKLRADTNGDGVIDDKDAPGIAVKAEGATLRVTASIAGQSVQYPLHVMQVQKGEPSSYIVLGSRGMLEGSFGQYTICFSDQRASGSFMKDRGMMQVSDGKAGRSGVNWTEFSRTIVVDGKLWQFEVVTENRQIKLTPYTGPVAVLTVQTDMPNVTGQINLSHVQQVQVGAGHIGQAASFVPGDYRVQYVQLAGESKPGANGSVPANAFATFPPTAKPVTLVAGANSIKVGAPFKMDFTATRDGATVEFTDVQLTGVAGEVYRPSAEDAQGEVFAAYIRSAGKEELLTKLSYG